jgi:hypothetical protein
MQRTGLASVSIFPILIMITIVEKFVATQIEKGNKVALILGSGNSCDFNSWLLPSQLAASYKRYHCISMVILITIPINIAGKMEWSPNQRIYKISRSF